MSCLKHLFQLWVQLTSKLTGPLLWRSVFLPRQHPAGWHSSITTVALRCGFWNWIFRRPEKSNNLAANDNWVIRDDWIAFSRLLVFRKSQYQFAEYLGSDRPVSLCLSDTRPVKAESLWGFLIALYCVHIILSVFFQFRSLSSQKRKLSLQQNTRTIREKQ